MVARDRLVLPDGVDAMTLKMDALMLGSFEEAALRGEVRTPTERILRRILTIIANSEVEEP